MFVFLMFKVTIFYFYIYNVNIHYIAKSILMTRFDYFSNFHEYKS